MFTCEGMNFNLYLTPHKTIKNRSKTQPNVRVKTKNLLKDTSRIWINEELHYVPDGSIENFKDFNSSWMNL